MIRTLIAGLFILALTGPAGAAQAERVVSIGGSVTEIIYTLGVEERIVGSDTTSTYPIDAQKTAKVGYMRALSTEGILSLNPDLMIMTNEAGPPPVLAQLRAVGLEVLELRAARSVDDILSNISAIAERLSATAAGADLIARIKKTSKKLKDEVASMPSTPSVMFVLHHGGGSPMVSGTGTAADAIIGLAGGRNAVQGYDGYKPLTPESAIELQPDFILVTSDGLENVGGLEGFLRIPGIDLTDAAIRRRVIVMDALYLLGFGPRTIDAALELNHQLTPQ